MGVCFVISLSFRSVKATSHHVCVCTPLPQAQMIRSLTQERRDGCGCFRASYS